MHKFFQLFNSNHIQDFIYVFLFILFDSQYVWVTNFHSREFN